jgi:hypothetical protein
LIIKGRLDKSFGRGLYSCLASSKVFRLIKKVSMG